MNQSRQQLVSMCKKDDNLVVLEYPVTHLNHNQGVFVGLNYISKMLLANTKSGCKLINGYSGYDPAYLYKLNNDILTATPNKFLDLADVIILNHSLPEQSMKLLQKENRIIFQE